MIILASFHLRGLRVEVDEVTLLLVVLKVLEASTDGSGSGSGSGTGTCSGVGLKSCVVLDMGKRISSLFISLGRLVDSKFSDIFLCFFRSLFFVVVVVVVVR